MSKEVCFLIHMHGKISIFRPLKLMNDLFALTLILASCKIYVGFTLPPSQGLC